MKIDAGSQHTIERSTDTLASEDAVGCDGDDPEAQEAGLVVEVQGRGEDPERVPGDGQRPLLIGEAHVGRGQLCVG